VSCGETQNSELNCLIRGRHSWELEYSRDTPKKRSYFFPLDSDINKLCLINRESSVLNAEYRKAVFQALKSKESWLKPRPLTAV
jgi:hypothetical protein